jgi:HEAT repeat protein
MSNDADVEVQSLLARLASDAKRERFAAVERLRELLPSVRDVMLESMTSADWKVRASAAAVLDHAPQDPEVERALVAAAVDPDARVRESAFHSLACAHCKPDGCVVDESVEVLVDGVLHDPSVRVRRKIAGGLMWGQQGTRPAIVEAFRSILAHDDDHILRERAAAFLAGVDVPRTASPYLEWLPAWERRKAELLEAGAPS